MADKDNKASVSQEVPTQPQDEVVSAPSEPVAPAPAPAADPKSDAREKKMQAREDAANATLARAEAIAKSLEDRAAELAAGTSAPTSAAALEATNHEKANVVTLLIQKAFSSSAKDLGPVVPFTPSVTLANNTDAGLITFEAGVEYQLPKDIVDDLTDRQAYYLNYKENLHIRTVTNEKVGEISGGGK